MIRRYWLLLFLVLVTGCGDSVAETAVTPIPFTPTPPLTPTVETAVLPTNDDFIVIATDAPNPPFADFDTFGNLIGFNRDVMDNLSALADLEYEFVVTPNEGVLQNIAAGSNRDFDAVMSTLVIPETPPEGIVYTEPYLELGQVMVVLADENELQTAQTIQPGMLIGVQVLTSGEEAARNVLGIANNDLILYEKTTQAIQALLNEDIRAVIVDSYSATYYTQAFPEQLKIAGDGGRASWIASKAYGIALAADNTELLSKLNQAIVQIQANLTVERLATAWLIGANSAADIDPGESRVGTSGNELVIGVVGQLNELEPAYTPDLLAWEIKNNVMSGLFMWSSNNELLPVLATETPAVAANGLEYTISLRQGLQFPDGSDFTAEDVVWSILRARLGRGGYLVNAYLKDTNDDGFADDDAVQVVDTYRVKFVLQQPTGYFLALLATPPYFPISDQCYAPTEDLLSSCGGLGPYTIVAWDVGEHIRLKANPQWPGSPPPAFENIQVRFYEDGASVKRSLTEFQSIDMAWSGLPYSDYVELSQMDLNGDGTIDFRTWQGPAVFKSYLIFEQSAPPWDSEKVRQAAAYAVDREALAAVFQGSRLPLYSPMPDLLPGYIAAFPQRDLARARALLLEEGYSAANPLPITVWYVNDGRYSPLEETYAATLKAQLEETGVFQVTLSGAAWETFRGQIDLCAYPAYLIGWPSPGQPVNYVDMTSYTDFFIQNTDRTFCSNYQSEEMTELAAAARAELDTAVRLGLYAQVQQLWAAELPTLELTQEPRRAIALLNVNNIQIDIMGLLHYEVLTKGG